MGSIARALAKLRNPVQASMGGLSQDFISGLNWYSYADNTVVIETGIAVCPYAAGARPVTLPSNFTLTIPTQAAGVSRVHLWFHDDDGDGVGTVVFDSSLAISNYFGSAQTTPTHVGWRYIGTVLLGPGLNPVRQQCVGKQVNFMSPAAATPYELYNGTSSTSAQSLGVSAIGPPALITSVILNVAGQGNVRFSASAATVGYTLTGAVFTKAATALSADVTLALGNDSTFQFISDVAGQTVGIRCTGYNFKR